MTGFSSSFDLSPGEYQVEIASVIKSHGTLGWPPETIVVFRLTEPNEKGNPQTGLGGRIVRAWFELESENSETKLEAEMKLDQLLDAAGTDSLLEAKGTILWVRADRVVMRSDPSRYKTVAVEFLPLDRPVRSFVQ